MVLIAGEWDRANWLAWGRKFGWELSTSDRDGAEFRVRSDNEQGYEYMSIPNRARLDIDRVFDDVAAM